VTDDTKQKIVAVLRKAGRADLAEAAKRMPAADESAALHLMQHAKMLADLLKKQDSVGSWQMLAKVILYLKSTIRMMASGGEYPGGFMALDDLRKFALKQSTKR